MKIIASRLVILLLTVYCVSASPPVARAQTKDTSKQVSTITDQGWPRKFVSGTNSFSVYQPQIELWQGNHFEARAAVANNQTNQTTYGVIWFAARTEIDKVNRLVTIADFQITKVSFPTAPDKAGAYQNLMQQRVPKAGTVIALDRLLADMAIAQAEEQNSGYQLKNDPPQIFFSTRPAILVLIDGSPVLRPVAGTKLQRVINTRVLIVEDEARGKFYLHLMDGWLEADTVTGPWAIAQKTPNDLQRALQSATDSKQVDLLDGSAAGAGAKQPSLKEAANRAAVPTVYVSTEPAELLQTRGELQLAAIGNTTLIYVTNTENDIFLDTATQSHYVLISGRWFRAPSMKGPWEYVPGATLPAEFARIPPTHPKADVLVSVPGTAQAREALIANQIPQTATITRSATRLTVSYDGQPQFQTIEGTPLRYAINTPTPVIAVEAHGYYAVQNGVWFVAAASTGPWAVAASVPTVIYTIPPSSPVHYVTYVKVYGSTPEVVYVGYTPGYYGTVISSDKVVVYGAGWTYPPYIGTYWYGTPWTYGYSVGFAWSVNSGWGVAYGVGYGWSNYYYPAPWYGSVSWGYVVGTGYAWGGAAAANVYGTWGNVAYAGTRAAWANPYTGNYGRGGAYSGVNTVTGTRYNGRGGINTNIYTGTTVTGGGGAAYNPNTGRASAGQVGVATNAYTGNSAAGARGASYNTRTGVISGGAGGAVHNAATGQTTAGASRFAYNTQTGTGVAVGNNNVYAGKDGNVYRYNQSSGLQQRTDSGWQVVNRPADTQNFQNLQAARGTGQQRWDSFRSSSGGRPVVGGGHRPSDGPRLGGGGGFRGGGRRR